MKYYRMYQDKRIRNAVVLKDFPTDQRVEFGRKDAEKLKEHTILFTLEEENSIYPALLEAPMTMVQEEIWQVIALYDSEVVTKQVSLFNQEKNTRVGYRMLLLDRLNCLHIDSEFYPDHQIRHLLLDQEKVKGKEIFRIAGVTPEILVVSMNLVESILRRKSLGVRFQEIECR